MLFEDRSSGLDAVWLVIIPDSKTLPKSFKLKILGGYWVIKTLWWPINVHCDQYFSRSFGLPLLWYHLQTETQSKATSKATRKRESKRTKQVSKAGVYWTLKQRTKRDMHVCSDSGIQKEQGIKGNVRNHEANAQGRKIKEVPKG